ncbi:MAG: GtrA family protein [Clostridia bacterium]|nr:GtrA family protein [Clostridia bacterium]
MPEAKAILTADSDGQHTVPDCIEVVNRLFDGEDALYLGSRDFSLPQVPPKSRFGNRMTSVIFKLCYGKWLPDTQTGLRAFRASELPFMEGIEGERYEYEMNVLISCARRGLPMIPVTIETVYENGNEGTHFHPIRDSWRIYKLILGSFVKFMGSSLLCVLIDQVAAAVFHNWLLPLFGMTDSNALIWGSGLCARVISAIANFSLNRAFVFKFKSEGQSTAGAAVRYAILCIAIICLSNLGVMALTGIGMARWLAKLLCDTLLYFVSYRVQSNWVFPDAKKE